MTVLVSPHPAPADLAGPAHANQGPARHATVVVIGAGQAGLSAGYHLAQRGFVSALDASPDASETASAPTFVMLDANPGPGGAWQHRWASLTVSSLNRIFDLPGLAQPEMTGAEPSREAIPHYFGAFEERFALPIERPARVLRVRPAGDGATPLAIETDRGDWMADAVINATGTWNHPVIPEIPGGDTFRGRQLHTREYTSLEDFAGQRVGVVGGGISAIQHLEELSRVAHTAWYTRRLPNWRPTDFNIEAGRDTIARVTADVEAGHPTGSVVSYTGLPWTPYARAAEARGALDRRPMFTRIEPGGVREADGSFTSLDAIVWATGFRADLAHLAPLGLENSEGGIEMRGTRTARNARVHLIGFGPSSSTVGANRAGREAVADVIHTLAVTP